MVTVSLEREMSITTINTLHKDLISTKVIKRKSQILNNQNYLRTKLRNLRKSDLKGLGQLIKSISNQTSKIPQQQYKISSKNKKVRKLVRLRINNQQHRLSNLYVVDTIQIVTRQRENVHTTIRQKNVNFSLNVHMETNACLFIQKPYANLLMHATG